MGFLRYDLMISILPCTFLLPMRGRRQGRGRGGEEEYRPRIKADWCMQGNCRPLFVVILPLPSIAQHSYRVKSLCRRGVRHSLAWDGRPVI